MANKPAGKNSAELQFAESCRQDTEYYKFHNRTWEQLDSNPGARWKNSITLESLEDEPPRADGPWHTPLLTFRLRLGQAASDRLS